MGPRFIGIAKLPKVMSINHSKHPAWLRYTSLGMAVVFFYAQVAYAAIEPASKFWQERKTAAEKMMSGEEEKESNQKEESLAAKVAAPQEENALLSQLPSLQLNVLSNSLPKLQDLNQSSIYNSIREPQERTVSQIKVLPNWVKSVPASYANLKEIYIPEGWKANDFMVIHIQDAHQNYEAQKNIARILESLATPPNLKKENLDLSQGEEKQPARSGVPAGSSYSPPPSTSFTPLLVGVEGAKGAFGFEPYRAFPDKRIVKEIADYFLKSSLITGAEYVGMTLGLSESPIQFWGVEDKDHYLRHVQSFKDSIPKEKEAKSLYAKYHRSIEAIKGKIFNAELRELDAKIIQRHQGSIKLGDYLKFLTQGGIPQGLGMVRAFMNALTLEESLNYDKVEKERRELTRTLSESLSKAELKNLVSASISYRLGNISYGAFYHYLTELCGVYRVNLNHWKEFDRYIRYVMMSDSIRSEDLFAQIDELEKRKVIALAVSREEKELIEISSDMVLIEKLIQYSLSPEDWKKYQERFKVNSSVGKIGKNFMSLLVPFEEFNKAAIDRNNSLVENLLKKDAATRNLRVNTDNNVAVLIAGGFHTAGMTELLKQKKVAYAVLTPRLGKVDGKGTDYLEVFRRDRTPLEKLFTGERITLSPEHATALTSIDPANSTINTVVEGQTVVLGGNALVAEELEITSNPKEAAKKVENRLLEWLKRTKMRSVDSVTIKPDSEVERGSDGRSVERFSLIFVLRGLVNGLLSARRIKANYTAEGLSHSSDQNKDGSSKVIDIRFGEATHILSQPEQGTIAGFMDQLVEFFNSGKKRAPVLVTVAAAMIVGIAVFTVFYVSYMMPGFNFLDHSITLPPFKSGIPTMDSSTGFSLTAGSLFSGFGTQGRAKRNLTSALIPESIYQKISTSLGFGQGKKDNRQKKKGPPSPTETVVERVTGKLSFVRDELNLSLGTRNLLLRAARGTGDLGNILARFGGFWASKTFSILGAPAWETGALLSLPHIILTNLFGFSLFSPAGLIVIVAIGIPLFARAHGKGEEFRSRLFAGSLFTGVYLLGVSIGGPILAYGLVYATHSIYNILQLKGLLPLGMGAATVTIIKPSLLSHVSWEKVTGFLDRAKGLMGPVVFKSVEHINRALPGKIIQILQSSHWNSQELLGAVGLIDLMEDLYKKMNLETGFYHNQAHNLSVSYGALLLAKGWGYTSKRDVKVIFLASFLHDFHLRNAGTPASVEETLKQLRDILGLKEDRGPPMESGFSEILSPEAKEQFKEHITSILGTEDLESVFLEVEAIIRRTDFGAPDQKEKIDREYALALDRIKDKERKSVIEGNKERPGLATIVEKGADQSGFYWLTAASFVKDVVVPGLQDEIGKDKASVPGSFPFFFKPALLNDEVLNILSRLPIEYKINFVKVMEEFARLSTQAAENLPEGVPVKQIFAQSVSDWESMKERVYSGLSLPASDQPAAFLEARSLGKARGTEFDPSNATPIETGLETTFVNEFWVRSAGQTIRFWVSLNSQEKERLFSQPYNRIGGEPIPETTPKRFGIITDASTKSRKMTVIANSKGVTVLPSLAVTPQNHFLMTVSKTTNGTFVLEIADNSALQSYGEGVEVVWQHSPTVSLVEETRQPAEQKPFVPQPFVFGEEPAVIYRSKLERVAASIDKAYLTGAFYVRAIVSKTVTPVLQQLGNRDSFNARLFRSGAGPILETSILLTVTELFKNSLWVTFLADPTGTSLVVSAAVGVLFTLFHPAMRALILVTANVYKVLVGRIPPELFFQQIKRSFKEEYPLQELSVKSTLQRLTGGVFMAASLLFLPVQTSIPLILSFHMAWNTLSWAGTRLTVQPLSFISPFGIRSGFSLLELRHQIEKNDLTDEQFSKKDADEFVQEILIQGKSKSALNNILEKINEVYGVDYSARDLKTATIGVDFIGNGVFKWAYKITINDSIHLVLALSKMDQRVQEEEIDSLKTLYDSSLVPRLIDSGEIRGQGHVWRNYILTEFIEGTTAAELEDIGPLTQDQKEAIVRTILGIAKSITYKKDQELIPWDIHTGNFVLTTDPKTLKTRAVMVDLGWKGSLMKSMTNLLYNYQSTHYEFIYRAFLDTFGPYYGINLLKKNLDSMIKYRETAKKNLEEGNLKPPMIKYEEEMGEILNHAIPELEKFIQAQPAPVPTIVELTKEKMSELSQKLAALAEIRIHPNQLYNGLVYRLKQEIMNTPISIALKRAKDMVEGIKNSSLDPLTDQESGEKRQKERLRELTLDQLGSFWFAMGDLDNISLLNKIFGKQIVGGLGKPQSPDVLFYRKDVNTIFKEIRVTLNELMRGYAHKGSGGDEFIPEIGMSMRHGEPPLTVEELERVIRKFNEKMQDEYAVIRIPRTQLTENEQENLQEDKRNLMIMRYGSGIHILVKRDRRTNNEIRKSVALQIAENLEQIKSINSGVIPENVEHIQIETDQIGLATVSIGAVSAQHLFDYIFSALVNERFDEEKMNLVFKTKEEKRIKETELKKKIEEEIRSYWLIEHETRLNPDRIDEFYTWGMRFANDMLQRAKESDEETGEIGRNKVEVSMSAKDVEKKAKKQITVEKLKQTRVDLEKESREGKKETLNKDIDNRTGAYQPGAFRSKIQSKPKNYLYMLKILDYGLNKYEGSSRGFHNAKSIAQEEGGDRIIEMLFKDGKAGIPYLLGTENLVGTNDGKEGTIVARAPPDTVTIASDEPIRGPPAEGESKIQEMRDKFTEKLNEEFKDQLNDFRKKRNDPKFKLNPQLVLIEVSQPKNLPQDLEPYFKSQFQTLNMMMLVEWLFEAVDSISIDQLREVMNIEETGTGVIVLKFSDNPIKIEKLIQLYRQAQDKLLETSLQELTGIRQKLTQKAVEREEAAWQRKQAARTRKALTLPIWSKIFGEKITQSKLFASVAVPILELWGLPGFAFILAPIVGLWVGVPLGTLLFTSLHGLPWISRAPPRKGFQTPQQFLTRLGASIVITSTAVLLASAFTPLLLSHILPYIQNVSQVFGLSVSQATFQNILTFIAAGSLHGIYNWRAPPHNRLSLFGKTIPWEIIAEDEIDKLKRSLVTDHGLPFVKNLILNKSNDSDAKIVELINKVIRTKVNIEDISGKVKVSFIKQGSHKMVFKVTFGLTNGQHPLEALIALKMENTGEDAQTVNTRMIAPREINDLIKLNGSLFTPLLGEVFYGLSKNGSKEPVSYIEEFIEGLEIGELLKDNQLTEELRRKIVSILLGITQHLGVGEMPSDIHGGNFILTQRDGENLVVMVDIGNKRVPIDKALRNIYELYGFQGKKTNQFIFEEFMKIYPNDGIKILERNLFNLRKHIKEKIVKENLILTANKFNMFADELEEFIKDYKTIGKERISEQPLFERGPPTEIAETTEPSALTLPILRRLFGFLPQRAVELVIAPILEMPFLFVPGILSLLGFSRLSQILVNRFLDSHPFTPEERRRSETEVQGILRATQIGIGLGLITGTILAVLSLYSGVSLPGFMGLPKDLSSILVFTLKSGTFMGAVWNASAHFYSNLTIPKPMIQRVTESLIKEANDLEKKGVKLPDDLKDLIKESKKWQISKELLPKADKVLQQLNDQQKEVDNLVQQVQAVRYLKLARLFAASQSRMTQKIQKGAIKGSDSRLVKYLNQTEIEQVKISDLIDQLRNRYQKSKEESKERESVREDFGTISSLMFESTGARERTNEMLAENGIETLTFEQMWATYQGLAKQFNASQSFTEEQKESALALWNFGRRSIEEGNYQSRLVSEEDLKASLPSDTSLIEVKIFNIDDLSEIGLSHLARQINSIKENEKLVLHTAKGDISKETVQTLEQKLKAYGITPQQFQKISANVVTGTTNIDLILAAIENKIGKNKIGWVDLFTEKVKFQKGSRRDIQVRILKIISEMQFVNVTQDTDLEQKTSSILSLSQ